MTCQRCAELTRDKAAQADALDGFRVQLKQREEYIDAVHIQLKLERQFNDSSRQRCAVLERALRMLERLDAARLPNLRLKPGVWWRRALAAADKMGPGFDYVAAFDAMEGTIPNVVRDEHPEATCCRCDGPNVVWFAPSPLWNAVMRKDPEREAFNGIVCPTCFVTLAEQDGHDMGAWRVAPQDYSDDKMGPGEQEPPTRDDGTRPIPPCETCGGSGTVAVRYEWRGITGDGERKCDNCKGTGRAEAAPGYFSRSIRTAIQCAMDLPSDTSDDDLVRHITQLATDYRKLVISGPNFDISAEPAPMGEDVFLPEMSSNIASRVADECGIELAGYPDRLEYGIRCVLAGAKARKAEGRT